MKLKKYQSGGIVYLPTVNQMGAAQQTAASSGSNDTEKVPGFTKEIISLIKENGLDSDVTVFLKKVQKTLDLANDPTGENLSLKEILKIQREANRVKQNYESYKTAENSLESQDAWAEPATTARGWLYVQDGESGEIKTINPNDYDPSKYTALTNQDLMNYRRSSPSFAFESNVLDNLSSAVGMKTITDYARALIKEFGKSSITGYTEKQAGKIREGMAHIVSGDLGDSASLVAAGPDGVYKISQEATVVDSNIKAALDYLKTTLPNSYQNILRAKAAAEGYNPEAMLLMMMYANTDRSYKADYDSIASKPSGSGSGSESSAQTQHTLAETYADGENGAPPQLLQITPEGSRSSLLVYGQNVGPVLEDRSGNPGNPSGTMNIAQLFEDAYGVRNVTSNTVVFGDQLINPEQLGGLVYNKSDMYRVVLPSKTINGGRDIVPDFELQDRITDIIENGKNSGADAATINRYIQQECPGAKYDPNTGAVELPNNRKHTFLTFGAEAADNYVDFNKDSKYLVKSDSNPDVYMMAAKYGKANINGNDLPRVEGSAELNGWFKSSRTARHLYTGNVFIPVTSSMSGTMVYNQEWIPKSSYTNITGRTIEHEKQMQVRDEFNSGVRQANW